MLLQEEGDVMSRPVNREEVKEAIFDIVEDKALGPDGFSSGFYKAAWSVIGDEITGAVQEFFRTGLLDKIISPSKNAFVPGRRISTNILLGQDIFHRYNRRNLPPRRFTLVL
ncbi:UNVERIFIED_CONTAM: hypothetical protein Slati_0883900 [Sesamum latifolium]|uniref:Uncharacterized protein n=1 Tax=Sesamum latifolium TaxID=2727402 RepID=A0AAW2XR89_9LAMI